MNLAITVGYPRLSGYYDYEPVSHSSELLTRKWAQEKNYLKGSASDWFPTIDAAFQGIRDECQVADGDGHGTITISDQVVAIARTVIATLYTLLPKGTPVPDITPEADGEICISWSVGIDRLFSLSIGGHGKINFAGQFGKEGGIHGWQPVDTTSPSALDESLQDFAKYLRRLYRPTAGRRAA
jgi:hypothetical protein